MTATPTFDEAKVKRDKDGKFADKPTTYQPQHAGRFSRETRIRTAASGMAASGLWALAEGAVLIAAIFSVLSASLFAWGGYKGRKGRRRPGAVRRMATRVTPTRTTGTKVTRFGTVRLTTAEDIEAYAKLLETKRTTRKKGSHFAQWPSATVTPDPSLSPEDKFKTLRNSGYKGWIDQDGNTVADVDEWIAKQKTATSP